MRRRELISGLAVAFAARVSVAQQTAERQRIAVVAAALPTFSITEAGGGAPWQAFFAELRRLGYVEDSNLIIERFSAEGQPERYPELARYVVGRMPDLIVLGTGALVPAFATATETIPIVSSLPEGWRQGLIGSLSRPGRNLTGVSSEAGIEIWGKRLQILKEAVPSASRVAYLGFAASWEGLEGQALRDASLRLGLSLVAGRLLEATPAAYENGFTALLQNHPDAMIVSGVGGAWAHRHLIVGLAATHRLPAIHPYREWVEIGGLMAYASDIADMWRRIAGYVHQVLIGAKPSDMPIYQATKFDLVINLKTAKALGLTIPQSLLALADEVIE
jgi:putative tryptophan/tyrosine transport system substrate-binding protein